MCKKRGQVSFAIVVAIILLILFFSIFFVARRLSEEKTDKGEELVEQGSISFKPVQDAVDKCLFESTESVLYTASRQGGFLHPEKIFPTIVMDEIYNVPIYLECGDVLMPSLESIEKDLSAGIESEFLECFQQSIIPLNYLEINYQQSEVDILFNEYDTTVNLVFPVEIKSGISRHAETDFSAKLNIPFLEMYKSTAQFLNQSTTNQSFIAQSNRFGWAVQPVCNKIVSSSVNLFVKPVGNIVENENQLGVDLEYVDLIQMIKYVRSRSPSARNYVFQFAASNANYADKTGCFNVPDQDMDGVLDDAELECFNTVSTIVDFQGCSCDEKICPSGKECINFENAAICADSSSKVELANFYNDLKEYSVEFEDWYDTDTIIYDCIYETGRCPYERVCQEGYKDAREDWRDECRLGEIQVETTWSEDKKYRCCKSKIRGSEEYAYHTTLFTWRMNSLQEDCKDVPAGSIPERYPLRVCGFPIGTAYSHDPNPDPNAIFGTFLSVAMCGPGTMDVCSSEEIYELNTPYVLSPYDDKDDNNDCLIIERTKTELVNNEPLIDSLFGEGKTFDEFIGDFNRQVKRVKSQNVILSGGSDSKIQKLVNRLNKLAETQEDAEITGLLNKRLLQVSEEIITVDNALNGLPVSKLDEYELDLLPSVERVALINDVITAANNLENLDREVDIILSDMDAVLDMIDDGADISLVIKKIDSLSLIEDVNRLRKNYKGLTQALLRLDNKLASMGP